MAWDIFTIAGIIGTVAFTLSGFLAAVRKHLDLMGIFIISMLTANGGGALRDVLVNRTPAVLNNPLPFYIAMGIMAAGLLLKLHRRTDLEQHSLFVLCDAVGLAAFSLTGALVGIEAGLSSFGVMVLAFLTATGGGILRDMLLGEVPALLSSDFYGTVSLLVAAGILALNELGALTQTNSAIVLAAALMLRLVAYWRKWRLPRFKT